ncbi:MAG: protease complex subunit PrcB family protein [Lachnospiraceae bacterium]|nr:protease complex subunit PrcB family protein [Lachnospiraceae bacterium]
MNRIKIGRKMIFNVVLLLGIGMMCVGCGKTAEPEDKGKELEYTVVADKEVPEELKSKLEERKMEPFKVTFADRGYIYICVGYGEQKTGGYSIGVKELYEADNAIYVDTILTGPTTEEAKNSGKSYPYIVIKTEYQEKAVVFE